MQTAGHYRNSEMSQTAENDLLDTELTHIPHRPETLLPASRPSIRKRCSAPAFRSLPRSFRPFLLCPRCEAPMEKVCFNHIQVERCTDCRGIWFDPYKRVELESMKGS